MNCRSGKRTSYSVYCCILAFVLALPSTGLSKSKEFLKPLPTPPDNSTPAPLPPVGFDPHFDISANKAGTPAPKLGDFWLFDIQRALAAQQYDKAIDACNAALASPTSHLGTATTLAYRAEAYAAEKKWGRALSDLSKAIKDKPQSPFLFLERGHCYGAAKQWTLADRDARKAVALLSSTTDKETVLAATNALAWLRATCPEKRFRDGHEAASLARRACDLSHWDDANIIDTYAAAKAESGQFESAAAFQEEAMSMPGVTESIRQGMAARLALYRRQQPYHEK